MLKRCPAVSVARIQSQSVFLPATANINTKQTGETGANEECTSSMLEAMKNMLAGTDMTAKDPAYTFIKCLKDGHCKLVVHFTSIVTKKTRVLIRATNHKIT